VHAKERPVYRTRPLPTGDLQGQFLIAEPVLSRTRDALLGFALAGIGDRGHEGLAFWAGRQHGCQTVYTTVVVPEADHSYHGVFVTEAAFGQAASEAKRRGVVILAQVHSHPGADARHSDGDDQLIVMPFESMLSVVVPNYGIGWQSMSEARVHQYQKGRWVLCSDPSVHNGIVVAPAAVDTR
jgi:proteasome lid subunit RPN8/RPN11